MKIKTKIERRKPKDCKKKFLLEGRENLKFLETVQLEKYFILHKKFTYFSKVLDSLARIPKIKLVRRWKHSPGVTSRGQPFWVTREH